MTQAAEAVLQAFEGLSPEDREEVFQRLLRRATEEGYQAFTDDELLAAGRALSAELGDYAQ